MSENSNGIVSADRRTILKGLAATGAAFATNSVPVQGRKKPKGDVTLLGGFGSGRDGWSTNGRNKLAQVSTSERPGIATQGNQALQVEITGDSYPMIENKSRVVKADFESHPYLTADVTPGLVSDTESGVTFQFRYHYADTDSTENRNTQSKKQEKSTLVVESDEITLPALFPSQLYWDMSELSDEALANPKRLEIVWYPTEHPPEGGARGQGSGYDYQGKVFFDNIRLSDTVTDLSTSAIATNMQKYKLNHGIITETDVESRSADVEKGDFVFSDGSRIPYAFEVVGEDEFVYTIDGEAFEMGGDQQ